MATLLTLWCAGSLLLAQEPATTPAAVAKDPGAELKAAIDAGHEWLQRHQDEDGRWSASAFLVHDPKGAPCDGLGKPDQDVFVTALVVTACFGFGQLPDDAGTHGHLCRALQWLQTQVQEDGSIGVAGSGAIVRDTGAAADVLASARRYHASGTVGADLSATVQKLRQWRREDGLWSRAAADQQADWVASTLVLECLAGFSTDGLALGVLDGSSALDPPGGPLRAATNVLDGIAGLDPATGPLRAAHGGAAHIAAWYVRDPERRAKFCTVLGTAPPQPHLPRERFDMLAWYFTTQAMQFHDEPTWNAWWPALVATAKATQRRDGSFAGSWDPTDVRGREAGRVYSTAAMLLALEVAWRKEYRDK
jgi:hypothetical protein